MLMDMICQTGSIVLMHMTGHDELYTEHNFPKENKVMVTEVSDSGAE